MNNGRPDRIGQVDRRTGETHIRLCLNLDGTGKCQVQTGIGFFDHMINGFTRNISLFFMASALPRIFDSI